MNAPAEPEPVCGLFGRDILAASTATRRQWTQRAFRYWRGRGFPYPELSSLEQQQEFNRLANTPIDACLAGTRLTPSTIGLRLANFYHPQIWSVPARRHRRSPIQYFADDEVLLKLLKRAASFWPNRRCWNSQCIRSALRIYAAGRAANFRPAAARAVISTYSKPGDTVLDFSAGFGGRLLGGLTLQRHFIAIDPAQAQITGLRKMVKAVGRYGSATADVVKGCAEDLLPKLSRNSVDLVFSSPPYYDVEKYSTEYTQSYRRYPSLERWKRDFLQDVLEYSHRALRAGGHLVLNIADSQRRPITTDLLSFLSRMFVLDRVLRLMMHSRPLQRSDGQTAFRWEPVFVLRKT